MADARTAGRSPRWSNGPMHVASTSRPRTRSGAGMARRAEHRCQACAVLAETPRRTRCSPARTSYAYILNCGDSAFETAAATLKDRRARLAPAAVGSGLGPGAGRRRSPTARARPAGCPRCRRCCRRMRRRWRRPTARIRLPQRTFTRGPFVEAEAAFTAIARDSTSPWRTIAPYLAARAMVRQAHGWAGQTLPGRSSGVWPGADGALNTILHDSDPRGHLRRPRGACGSSS